MRLALALLAFSLPAMAVPPCDTAEPKDVACIMSHDRNPEPVSAIHYEWYEISTTPNVFCAEKWPTEPIRTGRQWKPAALSWNPYKGQGQCFPAAGQTRRYAVWACKDGGPCSENGSNIVEVIGVAAADIRCCTPAGCGPC